MTALFPRPLWTELAGAQQAADLAEALAGLARVPVPLRLYLPPPPALGALLDELWAPLRTWPPSCRALVEEARALAQQGRVWCPVAETPRRAPGEHALRRAIQRVDLARAWRGLTGLDWCCECLVVELAMAEEGRS